MQSFGGITNISNNFHIFLFLLKKRVTCLFLPGCCLTNFLHLSADVCVYLMSCPLPSNFQGSSPNWPSIWDGREREGREERFHLLGEKRERRKFHGGRTDSIPTAQNLLHSFWRAALLSSFKHIPETAAKLGTNIGIILKGLEQTSRTFFTTLDSLICTTISMKLIQSKVNKKW